MTILSSHFRIVMAALHGKWRAKQQKAQNFGWKIRTKSVLRFKAMCYARKDWACIKSWTNDPQKRVALRDSFYRFRSRFGLMNMKAARRMRLSFDRLLSDFGQDWKSWLRRNDAIQNKSSTIMKPECSRRWCPTGPTFMKVLRCRA